MSQQDNKPFQWTSERVKELLQWLPKQPSFGADYSYLIDTFVASHSSSEKVEKDWEILTVWQGCGSYTEVDKKGKVRYGHFSDCTIEDALQNRGYSIHSVRRLSDGEVFSIGDKITYPEVFGTWDDGEKYCTITHFSIREEKIWVNNHYCGDERSIQDWVKAPIPEEKPVLFTVDGKGINIGDYFYVVAGADMLISGFTASENDRGFWKDAKLFLSKKEADKYVLLNKPCLSVNDILKCPGAIEVQSAPSLVRFSIPYDSLKQLASSKIKGGK